MATFELNSDFLNHSSKTSGERFERRGVTPTETASQVSEEQQTEANSLPPVKQESIIALKIYDSCRQQDCLDCDELGPARSAIEQSLCGKHYMKGEIIDPPDNAASVSIDCLRIKKIIIVEKHHNPFKRGFWDIGLKFVFEYRLAFREANGEEIGYLEALSIFNKKVTLFGSVGSDIVISTDLFHESDDDSPELSFDPFVEVEAKAIPLSAKLRYARTRPGICIDSTPNEVIVTIGLFTIIKLYRIVTLLVESRGFGVPKKCEEYSPINVCEYFDRIPFPMDIFAPPQRREFEAGISSNIANDAADEPGDCTEA